MTGSVTVRAPAKINLHLGVGALRDDGFHPLVTVYQADPATGNSIGVWDQTPYGGALVVKIKGDYKPIIAGTLGIVPDPLPLQAVAMMLSEAN